MLPRWNVTKVEYIAIAKYVTKLECCHGEICYSGNNFVKIWNMLPWWNVTKVKYVAQVKCFQDAMLPRWNIKIECYDGEIFHQGKMLIS